MATFPPHIERWRPIVEKYMPPHLVDKMLHVIRWESNGDPTALGDGGRAVGLTQTQDNTAFAGRPTRAQLMDPEFNIKYAAQQLGAARDKWTDWGEGATYQGKPFGALGAHPMPSPKPSGPPQFSQDNLQLTQVPPAGANPYSFGPEDGPPPAPGPAGAPAPGGAPVTAEYTVPTGDTTAAPTVRIDKKTGKGYEWNRDTKQWTPAPLWDEPPQAVGPAAPPPVRLDGNGLAHEWNAETREWVRTPQWDNPKEAPSQAQSGIPRSSIPQGAVDVTGTGTLFEMKQGNKTITWERTGTDRSGNPIYSQSSKDAAAAPKTALQLLAEQFNQAMGTIQGNQGATGQAPPQIGGSVSTAEGGSAAGPGTAPAGTAPGAIYGIDRAGNTQPTAMRIQTPGSGSPTTDINATNIYQTLGQWGVKPTGDFQKDAAEAAQLQVRQEMQTQLAGGDPLLASKAIDAMTGGVGGRNGYYPTPQMQQMMQGTVSRSPYDGKGVKLDAGQLEGFTKADPRDYDRLYGFASGGTVGANVDELPVMNPIMPVPEAQQVPMQQVMPATNPLPVGAIGEDFEGNPLYQPANQGRGFGPRDGGRGGLGVPRPQRDPYASGMNRDGTPFVWQSDLDRLPVNFVSWREAELSNNFATIQNARRQQAMARGMSYAQAARAFPFYDPMFMNKIPGMGMGGTITAGGIRDTLRGYAGGGQVGAGMPGVTPAPAGAQMMTQEPIMGVGMQTGQPQFVAGEAGPENINIEPVVPPVTDFARLVETMFGIKRANRPRATKPAGVLMGAGGGY